MLQLVQLYSLIQVWHLVTQTYNIRKLYLGRLSFRLSSNHRYIGTIHSVKKSSLVLSRIGRDFTYHPNTYHMEIHILDLDMYYFSTNPFNQGSNPPGRIYIW
jgi:hypothetical protein